MQPTHQRIGRARRSLHVLYLSAFLLATILPTVGFAPATALAASARTTDNVNLRNGAGTGFAVILVIPRNTTIDVTGSIRNGFYPVTYNAKRGWVASQYVVFGAAGADTTATATQTATATPVATATATAVTITRYTTSGANLRGGPSTRDRVIVVVPRGSAVTVTGAARSGFTPVTWNFNVGWISTTLLTTKAPAGTTPATSTPTPTATATATPTSTAAAGSAVTTARVNLRATASLTGTVLVVVPENARVTLTGQVSNGFARATYGTRTGWIAQEYLGSGTATPTATATPATPLPTATPTTPTGGTPTATATFPSTPSVSGQAWVSNSVNLRTGPGTGYSRIVIVPHGDEITLLGQLSGGFAAATWKGYTGWLSNSYVVFTKPVLPTPPTNGPTYTRDEIIAIIYAAADAYGQSRVDMLRVATCESNLDPYNLTPPYSASGLFQFLPGTWATTPFKDQSIWDPVANANAAAWMWSVGRRNEWVCQ